MLSIRLRRQTSKNLVDTTFGVNFREITLLFFNWLIQAKFLFSALKFCTKHSLLIIRISVSLVPGQIQFVNAKVLQSSFNNTVIAYCDRENIVVESIISLILVQIKSTRDVL